MRRRRAGGLVDEGRGCEVSSVLEALAPVAGIVADAFLGRPVSPVEAARAAVRMGLAFVPVDDLKAYLDDEAKARAELAFEAAKLAKYGPADG